MQHFNFDHLHVIRDQTKDQKLLQERGIGFQVIQQAIRDGCLLGCIDNPSQKHPHQKLLIVDIQGYPYAIPCIMNDTYLILKTIFPCRNYKSYLQ